MADNDNDSLSTALTAQPPNAPPNAPQNTVFVQPRGVQAPSLLDSIMGFDRNASNANVVGGQARNGLLSAQTQAAIQAASEKQREATARDAIGPAFTAATGDDKLGSAIGAMAKAGMLRGMEDAAGGADRLVQTIGRLRLQDPANIGTPTGIAAQASVRGEYPNATQAVAPNYIPTPGMGVPIQPQQTAQGAAQTAQTKAVTVADLARAEEEHTRAVQNSNPASSLDPGTLDTAARVVMSDPTKMSQYAGFGQSGQNNKNGINNRITQILNDSGMKPEDMIRQRALAKASVGAAGAAAKQAEVMDAFTPLVRSNGQRILDLINNLPETNIPVADGMARAMSRGLGGVDAAELHSVFGTFQQEVARLVASNPNMTGVLSDKARGDVQSMVPENVTGDQARRVVNRVLTEIDIRRHGVQDALDHATQTQVVGAQPQGGAAPAAQVGAPKTGGAIDLGGGWTVTRAP